MFRNTIVHCFMLLVVVAAVCVLANAAMADTLLLSDNFNYSVATGSTSINAGIHDGRLSGTYSSSQYIIAENLYVDGTGDSHPGNLELSADTSDGAVRGNAVFGHTFYGADSAGGLEIDLRCKPTGDGSTSWMGVLLGHNGSDPATINSGLFVAFRQRFRRVRTRRRQ